MSLEVLGRLNEFGGEVPVEDAGHKEACHDDAHDKSEGYVKEELGDKAAGGNFVDVTSVVALHEAVHTCLQFIGVVEDSGGILSSSSVDRA